METYASLWTHPMAEEVTKIVADSSGSKYVGWDKQFDAQFAQRTVYASVRMSEKSPPLALTRLVFKRLGAVSGPLPLEMGRPRIRVLDMGEDVAEVTGIYYTDKMAVLMLFGGLARMLMERSVKAVFAVYNRRDPKMSDLIVGRAGFNPLPNETVVHPTFKHKDSGKAVRWHIAAADQPILNDLHRRTVNQLGEIRAVKYLR